MLEGPSCVLCSKELLQPQRTWTQGHLEIHQAGSTELSRHETNYSIELGNFIDRK